MLRDHFFGRLNARLFAARRRRERRPSVVEALESRQLLTTFYVDNNLLLTADRDQSGGLSPGDQVTFGNGQPYQQADLTYDAAPTGGDVATAFSSISQALTSPLVQAGDTIDIAGGTYDETGLTIDKSLTLQGDGKVVIEPAAGGGGNAGITIADNPQTVSLSNLDLEGFYDNSLFTTGVGTLNLTDMTLQGPPTIVAMGADILPPMGKPGASLSGITDLNVTWTSTADQTLSIGQPSAGPAVNDQVRPGGQIQMSGTDSGIIAFSGVDHLSVTVAPYTRIGVTPSSDTDITINGGFEFEVGLGHATGSAFSVTGDDAGWSGVWSFTNAKPIDFSHVWSMLNFNPIVLTETFSATEEELPIGYQPLAQFTEATDVPVANFSAEIDWGDGTTSNGSLLYFPATTTVPATYSVFGDHKYMDAGNYPIVMTVHRPGQADLTLRSSAAITESSFVFQPAPGNQANPSSPPLAGQQFTAINNAPLIEFTHGDGQEPASDFSVTIDWGDGTTSAGTVAQSGSLYTASGSHTYNEAGLFTITETISDDNLTEIATSQALIATAGSASQQFVARVYHDSYFPRVSPPISRQFAAWARRSAAVFGGLESEKLQNFPLHGR